MSTETLDQIRARLRTKVTLRTHLPGVDGKGDGQLVTKIMCNWCGTYGLDGKDVEGPYADEALYRCKDQPSCRKARERLATIRSWKGSGDEREGKRIGMAGDCLVLEELAPTLAKHLRNSPTAAAELIKSVEYQLRCLRCDRRDTFFVNKVLLAGPQTPALKHAFETKTIEKIKRLRQLGCEHTPVPKGERD